MCKCFNGNKNNFIIIVIVKIEYNYALNTYNIHIKMETCIHT